MRRRLETDEKAACGSRAAARGVSLIELIVVIALLAILTGVVGHHVGSKPEEAQRLRATAEVQTLAQALLTFESTVEAWPTLDAAGRTDRVHTLLSGARMPSANPWAASHPFWTWTTRGLSDLLHHHLLTNTPAGQSTRRYPTGGAACWRGPYVDSSPLDPWGRPYVANVVATHSADPTRHRRLFVVSAGPDGRFQTNANATASEKVAGDDIGCLVFER